MAGHSHWSQIKRAKGAADVKRGHLFSKLSKEITVAVRLGGGDPNFNPRLRTAISTARAESMPVDNIDRAIKKGTGELEGGAIEEIVYEGYGPGGTALLVETATDNKNRTAAEVRNIFTKNEGHMAGAGSVAWMFKRKGYFFLENTTDEAVFELAIENGADDVRRVEGGVEIVGPADQFYALETALKKDGYEIREGKLTFFPENVNSITDEETAKKVFHLIEMLEEHDDVQNVHANFVWGEV
jgi:YebC/PmpR family DNA-binding regulatory protein